MPKVSSSLLTIQSPEIRFASTRVNEKAVLKLSNNTDKYVHFKLKTTVPKCYLVRPCNGVATPNSSFDLSIVCLEEDPNGVKKHKFLIQTFGSDSADFPGFDKIPNRDIYEMRLSCKFNEIGSSNIINEDGLLTTSTSPTKAASSLGYTVSDSDKIESLRHTFKLLTEKLKLLEEKSKKVKEIEPCGSGEHGAPSLLIVVLSILIGLVLGYVITI